MDYFVIKYPADGDLFPEAVYVEYKASKKGYCFRRYNTEILPGDYISSNWKRIPEKEFISGIEEYKNA